MQINSIQLGSSNLNALDKKRKQNGMQDATSFGGSELNNLDKKRKLQDNLNNLDKKRKLF